VAQSELTRPYEPNLALRALYRRLFDKIQIDETWAERVRELSERGTVVHVLRSLNFVDFFALDYLTKRHGLPAIRFANDLGLWILSPMGKGWLNAIVPRPGVTPSDELRDALEHGGSAVLFLKRPPTVVDLAAGGSSGRGLKEGDDLVATLLELQRHSERPILLLPQVFVWSKQPDKLELGPLDFLLGPRDSPTPMRTVGQILYNYKHVALKVGEPLDLAEFQRTAGGASDAVNVRRVTYAMLRRLERERRSVTGPVQKTPDRIRHEILRSPKLRAAIDDLAGDRPEARYEVTRQAVTMLRALQATPDMATIRGLEALLDRIFNRIYAGIEYDKADVLRIRQAARDGTLVLLPSHKSHIDYLILSYIFNQENLPLPLIAAGDNLNFFPVGAVFRRAGAFFIRRSFKGDRLYAAIVDAYVRRLMRDGYPIELFLEGGRSRTGKLLEPKFGLLNMVVDAALAVPNKQVRFVPVSIGYERVVEAESYERELAGGEKQKEDAAGLLKSTDVLRHRYGRINMQVGQILTLEEIRGELGLPNPSGLSPAKRRAMVTRLGNRVMDEINRVTAVTPGALTALGLLSHPRRGVPHGDLVSRCRRLLAVLVAEQARMSPATATISGALRPESIREAVQMFVDAELVQAHAPGVIGREWDRKPVDVAASASAIYTIPDEKRLGLDTSKNIIVHFFVERALVAIVLLSEPGAVLERDPLRERVRWLSRLFKHEFRFRADAPFDRIFEDTLGAMLDRREVAVGGDGRLGAGEGTGGWSGHEWLACYSSILRNFVEGYRVAARSLGALVKAPVPERDLVKRALALGERMFLAGEIDRREAISKPLVQNAYEALIDERYLQRDGVRLELAEEHRSVKGAAAIEARISAFMGGAAQ
jgi:glycerol-3-phosphate O-acyltransferase